MTKEKNQALDLAEFDSLLDAQNDGKEIVIPHPITGEDTDMKVMLAGPDSKLAQKARRQVINSRMKKRVSKAKTAEAVEKASRQILAACVMSWSGFVVSGEALECTEENVLMVFQKYPFVRETLEIEHADRAEFLEE